MGAWSRVALVGVAVASLWVGTRTPSISLQLVAPPSGTGGPPVAELLSVSCPRGGGCVSVGDVDARSGTPMPMAVTRASGRWLDATALAPPIGADPSGYASMLSVACVDLASCVAVGTYSLPRSHGAGERPMVAYEHGGTWSRAQPIALPPDAQGGGSSAIATAVSCPSASRCDVLGWYAGHAGRIRGFHAIVNLLSDETLPAIALPIPTTGPLAGLGDLRIDAAFCKSAWACVAVGDFRSNVNDYGFVVQEIGGQWAAPQLAPLPPGVSPATADWYLTSVACTTTDTCIAVGVDTPSGGGPSPLVDVLSSTGWRATQPPTVPSPFTPASVSCSSANWCVAVGSVAHATSDFDTTSLPAFAWGTEQRLVAGEVIHHFTGEPRFTNATALWGIDCTSGVCTAVGSASEVGPHIVAFEDPIAGAVRR